MTELTQQRTGEHLEPSGPRHWRLSPADLGKNPEVAALLERFELGEFVPGEVVSYRGRNDNWAGRTTSGANVFVKRIGGGSRDAADRLRRATSAESVLRHAVSTTVVCPRLLGFDEESGLLAFEWLDDSESGAELALASSFDDELARDCGRIIADLHAAVVPAGQWVDDAPAAMPPLEHFHALPYRAYVELGAGALQAWRLLQRDEELVAALTALREQESRVVQRPIHGDLRLDQILLADGTVYLTDWEEFRWADPARDIGSFAGEWIYRAITGMATAIDADGPQLDAPHEQIVEAGASELERVMPRVRAFWLAYTRSSVVDDSDLSERATAFAGWHLIERMLASSMEGRRLTALERAAAGIGRTALLAPAQFQDVIGLGETQEAGNAE